MLDRQLSEADFENVFSIIGTTFHHLVSKPGIILINVLVCIIIWGSKGNPIFTPFLNKWLGSNPSQYLFKVQMLSFSSGLVLLVLIPMLFIKYYFKEPFANYGLARGNLRLGIAFFLLLMAINLPLFFYVSHDTSMQAEYPLLFRGLSDIQIKNDFNWNTLLIFELTYALFFFIIEFIFRGYMLFGLREKFGLYSVLIQMLSYTAWRLTKPMPEFIGTPLWGFVVAAVSLRVGSIWYVFAAHWLLNISLDIMILYHRGIIWQ